MCVRSVRGWSEPASHALILTSIIYYPLPVPTNPRDVEIYRLHTEEMCTIPSLTEEFGLKEKSVWGICTRMRNMLQVDDV
jgi:hypothetical protein